jgi:protein TonB
MVHGHYRASRSTATFTRQNETYVRTCLLCLAISAGLHALYLMIGQGPSSTPYAYRDSPMQVLEIPFDFTVPPAPPEVPRQEIPQSLTPVEAEVVESVTPKEAPLPVLPAFTPPAPVPGTAALPPAMDGGFVAFDTPPERLLEVKPEYPELGVEAHSQGTVLVQVTIDETGKVIDAVVLQSEVISALEEACLKAARATPFRPAKQRDVPVRSRVVLPFRFALKEQ